MRTIISYPPRALSATAMGYNLIGQNDASHVNLAMEGGALYLRNQFGWSTAENYNTGVLALSTQQQNFLSYCAAVGARPVIVAAYGPPYTTIGSLTTTSTVASGAAAGTNIPVSSYGFSIDVSAPICFMTSPIESGGNGGGNTITNRWNYYGSLITAAGANSIQLAAATAKTIPSGTTLNIQKLRYAAPITDSDPSITAYIRYAKFLADSIGSSGANGAVCLWNELNWPNDAWPVASVYYDSPPGGITVSTHMKGFLSAAQSQSLFPGVFFINGASDKTGFSGITVQGVAVPGAVKAEGLHPYGNNPEASAWDYYAWGFNGNRALPATLGVDSWWEIVNPNDISSNLRNMAFTDDLTPNAPVLHATECGSLNSNDLQQARYLTRRVASLWGMGVVPYPYTLDDGSAFSTAPGLVPRQSFYALQRMNQIINRMASGFDSTFNPTIVDVGNSSWPIMSTCINGAKGHSTLFVWQMTNDNSNWTTVASPSPAAIQVQIPFYAHIMEATDMVTGADLRLQLKRSTQTVSVPVADNPIAIRFAPARAAHVILSGI